MYKSGLVIVTKGFSESNLKIIYNYAQKCINHRLYISAKSPLNCNWKSNIKKCYNLASKICPNLDVRLLLPYSTGIAIDRDISVILCDDSSLKFDSLRKIVTYETKSIPDILLNFQGTEESIIEDLNYQESEFSNVCLGGTFDRLHNGHKILLSLSALLTRESLFCGVSRDELLKDKCLFELIEPLSTRINGCMSFLKDIKPGISYSVCPISDPYGPTIEEKKFDCLVGSMETKTGCEKINQLRENKGFPPLHIELIEMVGDDSDQDINKILSDTKISSSKCRLKLLGNVIKPIKTSYVPGKPYIIGLCGGIASGKSSIVNKLKSFGAEVIDCDKLGHEAYTPGSDGFNQIVSTFGQGVVMADTGTINRAVLGAIVFQNPLEMKKLTDIVWPAISNLVQSQLKTIEESYKNKKDKCIVLIDAAVLLDAEWEKFCNEVWVTFIPKKEAVLRLKNRNNLNEMQAESRINSQKPNRFYVDAANVVFCTLWSYEFTHKQLRTAWDDLLNRLKMPSTK